MTSDLDRFIQEWQKHLPRFTLNLEGKHDEMRRRLGRELPRVVELKDGRVFPWYNGEPLAWNVGHYLTLNEQASGYPRARAVIAAMLVHEPQQLVRLQRELLKDAFDRTFGHVARRERAFVEKTIEELTDEGLATGLRPVWSTASETCPSARGA